MSEINITPQSFGRVAVLMGGRSAEREISLKSGRAVLAALQSLGVDAVELDVDKTVSERLRQNKFDRALLSCMAAAVRMVKFRVFCSHCKFLIPVAALPVRYCQ